MWRRKRLPLTQYLAALNRAERRHVDGHDLDIEYFPEGTVSYNLAQQGIKEAGAIAL